MMTALDANTGKSAPIKAAVKSGRFHIAPRLLVANAFTMEDVIDLAEDSLCRDNLSMRWLSDEQIGTYSQPSDRLYRCEITLVEMASCHNGLFDERGIP
jgi:hypothetical protein